MEWLWQTVTGGSLLLALVAWAKLLLQARKDGSDSSWRIHERGWQRASEIEEEAKLLRIALHKARNRSSVLLTISEIFLLAMPLPLEARLQAVKQAREIAERSLSGEGGAS